MGIYEQNISSKIMQNKIIEEKNCPTIQTQLWLVGFGGEAVKDPGSQAGVDPEFLTG